MANTNAYYVIVTKKGRAGGCFYLHRAPHNAVTLVEDVDLATKFSYTDAVTLAAANSGVIKVCI